MRVLAVVGLLAAVALTASGCASGRRTPAERATTDALTLRVTPSRSLPPGLVQEIDSVRRAQPSGQSPPTLKAEVYGPGTREALVRASSGAWVKESARERTERFYLIVLHGHFVAGSHPAGTAAPRGTIETQVWSAASGVTDSGIGDRLPAGIARLHEVAAIVLS